MKFRFAFSIAVLAVCAGIAWSETSSKPINDLPNGYRTIRDWAKPPGGVPWAALDGTWTTPVVIATTQHLPMVALAAWQRAAWITCVMAVGEVSEVSEIPLSPHTFQGTVTARFYCYLHPTYGWQIRVTIVFLWGIMRFH